MTLCVFGLPAGKSGGLQLRPPQLWYHGKKILELKALSLPVTNGQKCQPHSLCKGQMRNYSGKCFIIYVAFCESREICLRSLS